MNYYRKQPIYSFVALLLVSSILTGCVDLSGSRSAYRKKAHKHTNSASIPKANTPSSKKGEVHTMRGGLGIFSIGMNQLRDSVAEKYHISSRSTMWYNAGEVSRNIISRYYKQKEHRPIILVGHSLGANEQIKVARNLNDAGVPVALLVTVDAVSQTIVPPNVKQVLNVYKPGFVPMFSGLKLRAVSPEKTQIENVNVELLKDVNVNHFTIDKDKVVQAMILDKVEKVLIDGNKQGA
ncbi:hypothetical protein [uncultured Legionella sp.]|uniref:hypothetical protein n=1 Tax=uncultured Legionella sp. TaxID=210934 RepID=UPI0026154A8B|nr:hypothetical protein [uncultured Legionella sp.]